MGLTLVTPPTVEPVTLAEAKAQVRVSGTAQDTYLGVLVSAASRFVERYIGRSLTAREWKLTLDAFADSIELPMGPVTDVVSVQYVDENGDLQTLDPETYTLDTTSEPQWLVRNSAASWPATIDGINGVSITYAAGPEEMLPEFADLKMAILLLVGEYFDNRSASEVSPTSDAAVKRLCRPFRMPTVR